MKRMTLGTLMILGLLVPLTFAPGKDGSPSAVGPDLAGAVSASASEVPASAHQQADTIWIDIVADGESIAASPDSVSVQQGQAVGWRSELGNWRVFLHSPQPFGSGAVGQGLGGSRGQRRGWAVRDEAEPASYKYDIQVIIPGRGRVRVDPEIVVERRR